MTRPRYESDVNDDIDRLGGRVDMLERGLQRAHARMQWTGSVAMTTGTHYGASGAGGLTSLGAVAGAQYDSTADPYNSAGTVVNLTDGRLIAPVQGLYVCMAQATFAASATAGPRAVNVRRNAGSIGGVAGEQTGTAGASNSAAPNALGIWPLNAGDFFEITFFQNIGGNLSLVAFTFAMAMIDAVPFGL